MILKKHKSLEHHKNGGMKSGSWNIPEKLQQIEEL